MKLYMITSNKYTECLCPLNIHFLNKYWQDLDITIVGYDAVLKLKNLPPNVNIAYLGKQEDFGKDWSTALIPFFENVPEDYFTLNFEDHILMGEVDLKKLKILEGQFISHNVDKAMIAGGLELDDTVEFNNDLLLYRQGINYRLSLHPAIWTKKYFLKYLRPNMTPWEFEVKYNSEAMYDEAKIINLRSNFPLEPHLYSYLELYTKGKLNIDMSGNVIASNLRNKRFFSNDDLIFVRNKVYNL